MCFRDRLREEIAFKDFSVKELAAKVGISYSTFLSYIDARGVLPNVDTAVKIAEILEVSVEYLVSGKEIINENNNSEEEKILACYRKLSDSNKENLLKIAEVLK